MAARQAGRLWIGTSGWTYRSWRGRFYPEELASREYLAFYSREFATTEINYSFYHVPRPETFDKWGRQVPEDFLFSVKANRLLTHIKRLLDVDEAWRTFVHNALALKEHFGPILLQFPPSFRKDLKRLSAFLDEAWDVVATKHSGRDRLRLVFEFRHDSWFATETYRLLNRRGAALCIADGAKYRRRDVVTADFVYIRYHGRSRMFASNYSDDELAQEAQALAQYLDDGLDVYAYFNNDAEGYAVTNARALKRLLEGTR